MNILEAGAIPTSAELKNWQFAHELMNAEDPVILSGSIDTEVGKTFARYRERVKWKWKLSSSRSDSLVVVVKLGNKYILPCSEGMLH